ncbi:MAG TPA: sigma factor-like helix-turn-helix DNA-binding protein [candidate division Zixibacteria bacterium]|nr:sigma factor-like helix-turn-helix DNA-binding protein [candidate division Zixibacteria bacterium]
MGEFPGVVRFAEWMSALALAGGAERDEADSGAAAEIERRVRDALEELEEFERVALEHYHFMGRTPSQIAAECRRSERAVRRALREGAEKLRFALAEFVSQRFEIPPPSIAGCPICASAHRRRAERIIAGKQSDETWRRVIRELRERAGIEIKTPQELVGHSKYHTQARAQ